MNHLITTVEGLENRIGKAIAMIQLKTIDHLDEGALLWLSKSPVMFAGFGNGPDISLTLGGGDPGWAQGDTHELRLPTALLDDPALARPGVGFGSVFLLPAISEVLRVNGTVASVNGDVVTVSVKECYSHCGKALIRSAFWSALPGVAVPDEVAAFVAASRFMALATVDVHGSADVSPKGDQAAALARLEGGLVWVADRPGNKRIDSFRNILTQPHVAAMFLIPGSTQVAYLSGTAQITADETVRAHFAVQHKIPALVTALADAALSLHGSQALARANLWPVASPPEGIDPHQLGLAHLRLNKSLGARMVGTMMSVPGLMGKLMDEDYKKNLY